MPQESSTFWQSPHNSRRRPDATVPRHLAQDLDLRAVIACMHGAHLGGLVFLVLTMSISAGRTKNRARIIVVPVSGFDVRESSTRLSDSVAADHPARTYPSKSSAYARERRASAVKGGREASWKAPCGDVR